MRVNLTLNDTNKRDKTIIDFLNSRYSASGYIKELLYQVAKGNNISHALLSHSLLYSVASTSAIVIYFCNFSVLMYILST